MGQDENQNKDIIILKNNYLHMSDKIDELSKEVKKGFSDIKGELKAQDYKNEKKFVSKEKFEPVRLITYGLVGIILVTVLGAILSNML